MAGMIMHDEEYFKKRIPQPDLGRIGNFMRFIWDRERKAYLGRTPKEWGQLGIFYLCFYSVVGLIFAVQMKISIDYVSQLDKPFFQYGGISKNAGSHSRFSRSAFGSPGIVFKPNSISTASPIISVNNMISSTKSERFIEALSNFLKEYDKNVSYYDPSCHYQHSKRTSNKKPCFFDIKTLGRCSSPPYGYAKHLQPCVLIKFNKRFDWVPEYYNHSSILPPNMPDNVKNAIRQSRKFYVWLSCDGANNVDKEHIGEIEYIPSPGFPIEYFPFTGQPHYLSPIVALYFLNLTPNRLVTVECSLWAFNVEQRSRYALDFQIMIEG